MPRVLKRVLLAVLALAIAGTVAFRYSPWPGALLIRHAFTRDGRRIGEALARHVPPGITRLENQVYAAGDPDARLDVFFPDSAGLLPTIVWVHGGAWLAGSKDELTNYFRILAGRGFTVIGLEYGLAPRHRYPTPVRQVNEALAYIRANADRFHADTLRLFLGGDSGGAQIAAQVALVLTDSAFARAMGLRAGADGGLLRGLVLYCGPYDVGAVNLEGAFAGFLRTVLWSYSGRRDWPADTAFRRASVVNYVRGTFPPAFITVGNADPLAPQSRALAAALVKAGVTIDTLFYPADHPASLQHEYQFNLDLPEGRLALDRTVAFLHQRLR